MGSLCAQGVWEAQKILCPEKVPYSDTKSPRRRNVSRAWLNASAPIRILVPCSRRSQSSLLPLARQPLNPGQFACPPDLVQTIDLKALDNCLHPHTGKPINPAFGVNARNCRIMLTKERANCRTQTG